MKASDTNAAVADALDEILLKFARKDKLTNTDMAVINEASIRIRERGDEEDDDDDDDPDTGERSLWLKPNEEDDA